MNKQTAKRIANGSLIGFIGFILSPVSWWNDLFVNIPIAWAAATMFAWINQQLFAGAFITTYWITNIVGLVMLHKGAKHIISSSEIQRKYTIKELLNDLVVSLVYSIILIILIEIGVIQPIHAYIK